MHGTGSNAAAVILVTSNNAVGASAESHGASGGSVHPWRVSLSEVGQGTGAARETAPPHMSLIKGGPP